MGARRWVRGGNGALRAAQEERGATPPARLDDAAFRALFAKSPVKRVGRDRFIRNVLIAIGNSSDRSLVPEADRLLGDQSPLVRGAAIWALSQLLTAEEFAALASRRVAGEQDSAARAEWAVA